MMIEDIGLIENSAGLLIPRLSQIHISKSAWLPWFMRGLIALVWRSHADVSGEFSVVDFQNTFKNIVPLTKEQLDAMVSYAEDASIYELNRLLNGLTVLKSALLQISVALYNYQLNTKSPAEHISGTPEPDDKKKADSFYPCSEFS